MASCVFRCCALDHACEHSALFAGAFVQALSPTLLRIEPKGTGSFENRSTFMAVGRDVFGGIPIVITSQSGSRTTLTTPHYSVTITIASTPPTPSPQNCSGIANTDATGGSRVSSCDESADSCLPIPATQADCCGNCTGKLGCAAWIFEPSGGRCWLMASTDGIKQASDRVLGGSGLPGIPTGIGAAVSDLTGAVLWSVADLAGVSQQLNWPAPTLSSSAYAVKDYPRFHAPPWAVAPLPPNAAALDPGMGPVETNGYDFGNNQDGDTYVFLLGPSLPAWHSSRSEFVALTGPTPVLPDFAFGTWFTWWHQYTEDEAKGEVAARIIFTAVPLRPQLDAECN